MANNSCPSRRLGPRPVNEQRGADGVGLVDGTIYHPSNARAAEGRESQRLPAEGRHAPVPKMKSH